MPEHVINNVRLPGKRTTQLMAYALQHGWQVLRTRGGHLRFRKPGCAPIFTSSTPSDWRAYKNALAMLVRADREVDCG